MSPAGRGRRRLTATEVDLEVVRQRALLVGVAVGRQTLEAEEASLDELADLAMTAGADPVDSVVQQRDLPDPGTFIGKGKLDEIAGVAAARDVDVVVFDAELTPAQQRNLEDRLNVDVVDRVAVILDIFAQHAHSQEGMLQVELAQLRHRLPRLRGRGRSMSQQAAGIGTRGPGETQLEVDRRRILRKITKLERDLQRVAGTRATQRKARRRSGTPRVALVGYTNAGKSTLLNRLTRADVLVEDQLFSTLDPTTRRLRLGGGETVLLSDTVGFVRRLPHELVEAFRSTLEEVTDADLLVHVVDASDPEVAGAMEAVREVLAEIGADSLPEVTAFNKIDVADPGAVADLVAAHEGSVAISAHTGEGLDDLVARVGGRLRALDEVVELEVPYDRGDVVASVHAHGDVLVETHTATGTRLRARLSREAASRFREFAAPRTDDDRP
jgi:GTP-binding protein HflX